MEKNIIKRICSDLENLGFQYRKFELDEEFNLDEGEYLIKLFISKTDFHFIRFDSTTQIWFHKMGWTLEPKIIEPDTEELKENSKFGKEPKYLACGEYKAVCYFKLREK